MRDPTLSSARAGDLLIKQADRAGAIDGQRRIRGIGNHQAILGRPSLSAIRGTADMQSQKRARLPIAPHEIDHRAVVRIDRNRDCAADALLSSSRCSIAHEWEANPLDHALARKAVAGRRRGFDQTREAGGAPLVVPHHDNVRRGNNQSVRRKATHRCPPTIKGSINSTIAMGHRATLRTILAHRGPFFDSNGVEDGSSDTGVERFIDSLRFWHRVEVVVANVDSIFTGIRSAGHRRRVCEWLVGIGS